MTEYWADFVAAMFAQGLLAAVIAFSWGRAGVLFLGSMTFFGIGAYTVAYMTHRGAPWFLAATIGALLAAVLSGLVGSLTMRREGGGLRFSACSLVASLILGKLAVREFSFTGGSNGIIVSCHPSAFARFPNDPTGTIGGALVTMVVCSVLLFLLYRTADTLGSRLLMYVRDSPDEVVKYGLNIGLVKVSVAVLTAGGAAIAGGLYASASGIVSPDVFSVQHCMECLAWIAVGRMTPWGAFIAACLMRFVEAELGAAFSDWYLLAVAAIIVVVVLRYATSPANSETLAGEVAHNE